MFPTKPSVCPRIFVLGCEAWRSRGCFWLRGKVVERRPWNRGAIRTIFLQNLPPKSRQKNQDTADSNRGFWRVCMCFWMDTSDTSYYNLLLLHHDTITAMFFLLVTYRIVIEADVDRRLQELWRRLLEEVSWSLRKKQRLLTSLKCQSVPSKLGVCDNLQNFWTGFQTFPNMFLPPLETMTFFFFFCKGVTCFVWGCVMSFVGYLSFDTWQIVSRSIENASKILYKKNECSEHPIAEEASRSYAIARNMKSHHSIVTFSCVFFF